MKPTLMTRTWVLVADNSRARIFSADPASSDLKEINALAHPEGRMHEQLMDTDLPGKNNAKGGVGGHAYQDKTEPKEQEVINFAKRIGTHLEQARNQNKFEQLLIVSSPAFLGTLRHELSDQVRKHVGFELNKNLTTHSAVDIRAHLPKYLPRA